jgi:hypothetical protein
MVKAIGVAFILVLLLSAVAGTQFVNLGKANPYTFAQYSGEVDPPSGTKPPTISIVSPKNKMYNTSNIALTVNVSAGESVFDFFGNKSTAWISRVFYKGDWQQSVTIFYEGNWNVTVQHELQLPINLTDVPNGNRRITVYATEVGFYYSDFFHYYTFYLNGSSSVSFTIDTLAESFPATLAIAPLASMVVVGLCLLVYFKKRRH